MHIFKKLRLNEILKMWKKININELTKILVNYEKMTNNKTIWKKINFCRNFCFSNNVVNL